MSHQAHTYTELKQQIHDDLRTQHPEWIEPTGECLKCAEHEARLKKLLEALARSESNESSLLKAEIGGADRQIESSASDKSRGPTRAHNNPP
jgi:murein L,D-transpeptidase YcbB/YkuD